MSNYELKDVKLFDAVKSIENHEFQLPDFQRDFVWRESHRKSLIDSIQKGYPVGALLFLSVDGDSGGESPFGNQAFKFAPDLEKPSALARKLKFLVLDGQQRLTTSLMAFSSSASVTKWYFLDLRKLFESVQGKANVSIELSEYIVSKNKTIHPEEFLYSENLLPLPFLTLEKNDLRRSLRTYTENLANEEGSKEFADFVTVELYSYLDIFWDYKFPCVILPSSLDLEAVANVFTKLNTGGLSLTAFDLCVSNLVSKGVALRTLWNSVKDESYIKFFDSDGTQLLQTVALLENKPAKKATLVKNISAEGVNRNWSKAVTAFREIEEKLKHLGVTNRKTLPYDTLIPALAAALITSPVAATPVEKNTQLKKIEKWIFQTGFNQRYTEGSDTKKTEDFKSAKNWFANNEGPNFLDQVVWTPTTHLLASNGARYKVFLALLNKAKPKDFIQVNKNLGLENNEVQAQIHHVFPKAWVKNQRKADGTYYSPRDADKAFNMTFLTPDSNNFISDNPPGTYLNNLIEAWANDNPSIPVETHWINLKAILESHYIDGEALDCMLRNDFEGFLEARSQSVKSALQFMGINVVEAATAQEEDLSDDGEDVREE